MIKSIPIHRANDKKINLDKTTETSDLCFKDRYSVKYLN